jgi:tetratricopeptide (TPR) repeat protein
MIKNFTSFLILICFCSQSILAQSPASIALKKGAELKKNGKINEAILIYKKGIEKSSVGDSSLPMLHIKIATAYFHLGLAKEAKAQIFKNLGIPISSSNLYFTYNQIGHFYRITGNFNSSLFYLNKAELLLIKAKIIDSYVYANLRQLFADKGFREKELFYAIKTLELDLKKKDSLNIGTSYNDVGEIYGKLKQFKTSLGYFQKGAVLAKSTQNFNEESRAYEGIGFAQLGLGNYKNANYYFNKGLSLDQANQNAIGEGYGFFEFGNCSE